MRQAARAASELLLGVIGGAQRVVVEVQRVHRIGQRVQREEQPPKLERGAVAATAAGRDHVPVERAEEGLVARLCEPTRALPSRSLHIGCRACSMAYKVAPVLRGERSASRSLRGSHLGGGDRQLPRVCRDKLLQGTRVAHLHDLCERTLRLPVRRRVSKDKKLIG